MPAVRVRLELSELLMAGNAGVAREIFRIKDGQPYRWGLNPAEGFRRHIEGVIGEMVMSKFFNVYWQGIGKPGGTDVAGQQVRFAQPGGHMLLHDDDRDHEIFWLVRGLHQDYTVEGWMYAREGKLEQYWGDRAGYGRPCYWVPAHVLHDPGEPAQLRIPGM